MTSLFSSRGALHVSRFCAVVSLSASTGAVSACGAAHASHKQAPSSLAIAFAPPRWFRRLPHLALTDMAAGGDGVIYAVGHGAITGERDTAPLRPTALVAAWNGDGDLAWHTELPEIEASSDLRIGVDDAGNATIVGTIAGRIAIAGSWVGSDGHPSAVVVSLDRMGAFRWAKSLSFDAVNPRIAVSANGDIFIAGTRNARAGAPTMDADSFGGVTVDALDSNGTTKWEHSFSTVAQARAIAWSRSTGPILVWAERGSPFVIAGRIDEQGGITVTRAPFDERGEGVREVAIDERGRWAAVVRGTINGVGPSGEALFESHLSHGMRADDAAAYPGSEWLVGGYAVGHGTGGAREGDDHVQTAFLATLDDRGNVVSEDWIDAVHRIDRIAVLADGSVVVAGGMPERDGCSTAAPVIFGQHHPGARSSLLASPTPTQRCQEICMPGEDAFLARLPPKSAVPK